MIVTILAVVFLILLTAVAFAGFRMFRNEKSQPAGTELQKCSLCLRSFEKSLLIERQVGDYRLLRFCSDCILSLHSDQTRLPQAGPDYQSSFSNRI